MALDETLYRDYLSALLGGELRSCHRIVSQLLQEGITLRSLYLDLFQRSMYEVGELWQRDEISVATEHVTTTITESLMPLAYPLLFKSRHRDRRALITCVQGEYHQIGAHIVADYCEMMGWHSYTLGANTPTRSLLSAIREIKPDLVGLSASITFNLPVMEEMISAVRREHPDQAIMVGGRALGIPPEHYLPGAVLARHENLRHIGSLDALEKFLSGYP